MNNEPTVIALEDIPVREPRPDAVELVFDTSDQHAGVVVYDVEVFNLFPKPKETPTDFAWRCERARLLAQAVVERMEKILPDRTAIARAAKEWREAPQPKPFNGEIPAAPFVWPAEVPPYTVLYDVTSEEVKHD